MSPLRSFFLRSLIAMHLRVVHCRYIGATVARNYAEMSKKYFPGAR